MSPKSCSSVVAATSIVALARLAHAASGSERLTGATAEPVIVPIEIRDNFPILMANVNGLEIPLKFDLGDGDSLVLQEAVLDQLGATATGETAKMRGIDGVFETPLYTVSHVRLGTATFVNVVARADVRAGDYEPGKQGEKGFLGTGLLKGYLIRLDYRRREMTLVPRFEGSREFKSCTGVEVPFLPEWKSAPVTEALTDWGRAVLWWDTGSPVSALRESFVQGPKPEREDETATTKRFVLGDTDFGPVEFNFWAMELPKFDGLVGYNFFEHHVVCVDFPGHRLIVDSSDGIGKAAARLPVPAREQR